MTYDEWAATVKAAGGVATVWPWKDAPYGQYYGNSAARWSAAAYTAGANKGAISVNRPTQTTPDSSYVYVLAPDDVIADQPKIMTTAQKVANSTFSAIDSAATSLGLPSLGSIEHYVTMGFVVLGLIAAALAYLEFRKHD